MSSPSKEHEMEKENPGVSCLPVEDQVDKVAAIDMVHAYSPEENKRLVRFLDFRLMPLICISYGIQFIDKASLSYSALFNLREDTHLVGTQYASLTTLFYAGYLFFQLPANFLIQRYHVGRVLGIAYFSWGSGVMLFAACSNFGGLGALRWLIGMAEAFVSPAFVIIISQFYTRREQFLRVTIFCSMNTIFSCFSGVMTYFLGKYSVEHPGTLAGWKSINLLLGGLTVVWSLAIFFLLGTPETIRWLSPEQKLHIKARLVEGKGNSNEVHEWKWDQVRECFTDFQVIGFCVFQFLLSFSNGGITTFGSLVLKGLGFTSIETTYYQIPIYVTGAIWITLAGYLNYRFRRILIPTMVVSIFMSFMGFLLMAVLSDSLDWAKYGIYFTQTLWSTASFLQWSLIGVNIAGRTKKSVTAALTFMFYATGNMVGSQAYKSSESPKYTTGLAADCACFGAAMFVIASIGVYYVVENKRRDRLAAASGKSEDEMEKEGEIFGEQDITDRKNPHYRYFY